MNLLKKTLIVVASGLFLFGCGGGDNSAPPTTSNSNAEGLWQGTTSTGYHIAAVVLENGQYYSLYSRDGVVDGGYYGDLVVSGNTFNGSLDNIDYLSNKVYKGTISGTVVTKDQIQGSTVHDNNLVNTFTARYNSAYEDPASLSKIAGRYIGPTNKLGAVAVLNIFESGAVNGTTTAPGANLPRCIITGQAMPRPSGKNVYDLALSWANNPNPAATDRCCYGSICGTGDPATGIAVLDTASATKLYTAWISPTKTSGFLWIGQRQ